MTRFYYDLHIHSCLSPCADDESTPNSILGMGELNGLGIMALTDHNTAKNCPAFFEAAKRYSVVPVAGMELTTAEDIHLVCLFEELSGAMEFDRLVDSYRILIPNRVDIFGNQLVCDQNDEIIGHEDNLLSNATRITIDMAPGLAGDFGGVVYPAHIDREANGLTRLSEIIVSAYDRIQKLSGEDKDMYQGLRSGYGLLDSYIAGLNKSDLIIVAGRPGMGKSAFAFNIAANVAKKNPEKDICIFSLEMSKEQIATRMLSSEALVPNTSLTSGVISSEEWIKLAEAADALSHVNIYIDDTAGITVSAMKAKLRRMRNLGLVIIDYLQLMESTGNHTSRVNEVSEITRQVKLMAKELNVPIILASQLNRSVESRQDHRPMPSDLRESGSIEQDADIILFIYREGQYNKEDPNQSAAECIVAKNRHGGTGTVNMAFLGEYTLFRNIDTRKQ